VSFPEGMDDISQNIMTPPVKVFLMRMQDIFIFDMDRRQEQPVPFRIKCHVEHTFSNNVKTASQSRNLSGLSRVSAWYTAVPLVDFWTELYSPGNGTFFTVRFQREFEQSCTL
jgi:hypothetical protein